MQVYFTFAVRRFFQAVVIVFIVITLSFFLIRLAPGGPFYGERPLSHAVMGNLRAYYGLDQPVYLQYFHYMQNILRGDLGPSYDHKSFSVSELLLAGLPYSAVLGFWSALLGISGGLILGIIAAVKRNTKTDYASMLVALFGVSVPNFVLGPVLILFFAVYNHFFNAGGWGDGGFSNLFLPVLTLGTASMGGIARLVRASMIDALSTDHIRTVRAKGLAEHLIVIKHALRIATLPLVSFLGPLAVGIVTGSLIIENTFSLPGIGRYFIQAALDRDYPVVMGTVIFYSVVIVFFNLVADLLYGVVDPRVRLGE